MSLTVRPAFTVNAPVVFRDVKEPVPLSHFPSAMYVMLKFQYHWCALISTMTSGFGGIVSVVMSVWNAATPTTTRIIAGMMVHIVSRRRLLVWGFVGPSVWPLRTRNFKTA